jgi:tetraacyldisaccharide 4'-kinase
MSRHLGDLARRWWGGELGAAGTALDIALAPAEAMYRLGSALRNRAYDTGVLASATAGLPVISIGNISVGGTGKTPFTSWLALRLEARGERPAIVHGGYAADEPELLRSWTPGIPVIVDNDRARAAAQAEAAGASVVLLDDAYQHRRLRRDLDIVLVSVERWSATARLLPRGPWREPPTGLARAGLIACVRKSSADAESRQLAALLHASTGRPVVRVHLRAGAWRRGDAPGAAPTDQALAVSGLADPAMFVANVRATGVDVSTVLTFPDHHEYSDADVERMRTAAAGRAIVTSAKDWVKLRGRLTPGRTWILTQELVLEDGEALLDAALSHVLR